MTRDLKLLPPHIFITDTSRVDVIATVKNLPGNSAVILRDYRLTQNERRELGKEIRKICLARKIFFLIAKDIPLALELHADGIHLPEFMAGSIRKWRNKKPGWLITAAAHSRPALVKALDSGADAVLLSPFFETASHPGRPGMGAFRARKTAGKFVNRVYGLGGILPKREKLVESLGFAGVAAVSGYKNCCLHATVPQEKGEK